MLSKSATSNQVQSTVPKTMKTMTPHRKRERPLFFCKHRPDSCHHISTGRNTKTATDDHVEQDGAEAKAEEAEADDEEDEEGIAFNSVPEVLAYFGISGVTAKCPGWASKRFIAACISKVSNSWVCFGCGCASREGVDSGGWTKA